MSDLSEIRPKDRQRLIDLVRAAGVNVSDWANFEGGARRAASNPKYCYEWSFVEPGKVVVLCLWHALMQEQDGTILQVTNMRENARRFEKFSDGGLGVRRSLSTDLAIQTAFKEGLPIRVVVCEGERRDLEKSDSKASRVRKRLLDAVPWAVTGYDWSNGQCTLMRGSLPSRYADQEISDNLRAKDLAKRWGLKVRHALYRKTGNWYHQLKGFPGALLDADGYVIFESEQTFRACPQLQVKKQVSAPKGIKAISGYVYASSDEGRSDRLLVESVVRARMPARGQGWRGSAEGRKLIEAYAMELAVRHYSELWCEVLDVSATQPFDLLCRDGDRELRVEVKGTTSLGLSILLTRNEVHHAKANNARMALFVVSKINANPNGCDGGVIRIIEPWDIRQVELDPIAFECWLRTEPNTVAAQDS